MSRKMFNFVIAAPWPNDRDGGLCVYAWGNEVHCGDIEMAKNILNKVRSIEDKTRASHYPKPEEYDIYVLQKYQEEN